MAVLVVPAMEPEPWPTLGPQVCAFIERYLVHGPGDLRGEPIRLDAEKRGLIYRMYEIYPQDHPDAGRRRFRRVGISVRKGTAKTELAALIAACELHPDAPVRCVGWTPDGHPVGGPVTDPYIPMVAYTEQQSDELAYSALRTILGHENCELAEDFDIGLERIVRRDGSGKAVSLSAAPDSRDGARTTFQIFDESHRLDTPRLLSAHKTMLANVPKRKLADAWSLEVTTAFDPGGGSVAQKTHEYAMAVHDGRTADSQLFYFYRSAPEDVDVDDPEALRAAVLEASGPAAGWSDIDAICAQFNDPTADRNYLRRVWLNQIVHATERAFDAVRWAELADPREIPPRSAITIGFDGARTRDSTALVATELDSAHQWLAGLWERPVNAGDDWEVPADDVDATVTSMFERYDVIGLYADPPHWDNWIDAWAGRYGNDRVVKFYTNKWTPIGNAVRKFADAIATAELSHDGNTDLTRHIGNAHKRDLRIRDDEDRPLWTIQKDRPDSPFKIDAAMAAVLSWEARGDAIAKGALQRGTARWLL